MRSIIVFIAVIAGLFFTNTVYCQKVAIKSNVLYDATGTINLGIEVGLSRRTTLDIVTNNNLWKTSESSNKRLNHVLVQPEFRFWTRERFNGHFFGIHTHYAYYNFGGDNWLLNPMMSISTLRDFDFKNYHRKGWLVGAGISYGYQWVLHKRWSLEGTVGFGYAYMDYGKYENPVCGAKLGNEIQHYFGPTKIGITITFMIN